MQQRLKNIFIVIGLLCIAQAGVLAAEPAGPAAGQAGGQDCAEIHLGCPHQRHAPAPLRPAGSGAGLRYTGGVQLLPDGTLIIAAYDSKVQLYAIQKDPEKILWTLTNPKIGYVTHLMVLDAVDNSKPWTLLR